DPPINESFKLTEQDRTEGFLGKQSVYINFNLNNKSISNNINFRNAINKSLSKEYFIQKISKDFGVPATSYSIGQENEFDKCSEVSLAKKYLSEVKYEKDSVVKFLYKNNSIERRIADDIAKDIMEDLDIGVKLISYEEKDLDKILEGKDFDMMLYIYDNENTKEAYYYLWKSENNKFGFTDLQYDKLINNLESDVDSSKKNEVYKECEKLLLNKIPAIPIYNLNTVLCRKNFIENVYINKNGYLVLSELKISNEKQKEKS
ncbi:ABC transporter substrate-binding protein, partial [Clostridium ihumii]